MRAIVLVVDDEGPSAHVLARILRHDGHIVRVETSSAKAVEILESDEEFDLTLLDVLMPEPTGEMIVRRLRETAPARIPRIVFLTGMAYLVDTWLRGTGIPYIEKPATADKLLAACYQYARLTIPRGPRMTKKHKSLPELAELVDDEDDEEAEDTAVTIAKLARLSDSDPPGAHERDVDPHIVVVKFVSKKNAKLSRRIARIEKVMMVGWGFFLAIYVAFEIFKATAHK